jgi:hypothetical protein
MKIDGEVIRVRAKENRQACGQSRATLETAKLSSSI